MTPANPDCSHCEGFGSPPLHVDPAPDSGPCYLCRPIDHALFNERMKAEAAGLVGCERYVGPMGRSFGKRCSHCDGCNADAAVLAEKTKHPAKYSAPILEVIAEVLKRRNVIGTILDPMAGVGGIHELGNEHIRTLGIELEREWAEQHPQTIHGDAFDIEVHLADRGLRRVQGIVVSPPYGNRMADKYVPKATDTSKRFTYRLSLGRDLDANNAGGMQWGDQYRAFHKALWQKCIERLDIDAPMIVNCSDFVKAGERVEVCGWHAQTLQALGMELVDVIPVATRRMKFGSNAAARVDAEMVMVFR